MKLAAILELLLQAAVAACWCSQQPAPMQDEVIAASEKVTVKLEDLAKWAQADFSKWKHGLRGEAVRLTELGKNGQREALTRFRQSTHNSGLNFKDILKEKADLALATNSLCSRTMEVEEPTTANPRTLMMIKEGLKLCHNRAVSQLLPGCSSDEDVSPDYEHDDMKRSVTQNCDWTMNLGPQFSTNYSVAKSSKLFGTQLELET
ncbi:hypothetical protein lerEdw1_013837 [Lerista edwardsae]|nr:hypothetical protein lerEdw1_013837 [Lerista edwardsae]